MSVKNESYLYQKAKEDANLVSELATILSAMKTLEENGALKEDQIDGKFENKKLRDIKNAISNIYLVLNLHEVKGIADQIYNKDFKPVE